MGISEEICRTILEEFDAVVPYIDILGRRLSTKAQQSGFVRTVLGRHRHFDHWVPRGSKEFPTKTRSAAVLRWTEDAELERAWCYKAFNALIQGSAADQTKKALVDLYSTIGLPQMTVHDEISLSVVDEKQAMLMKEIMEQAVPLLCPAQCDMDLGPSWC